LQADLNRSEQKRQERIAALGLRLAALRRDQLYEDKLDGKITEERWTRKHRGVFRPGAEPRNSTVKLEPPDYTGASLDRGENF